MCKNKKIIILLILCVITTSIFIITLRFINVPGKTVFEEKDPLSLVYKKYESVEPLKQNSSYKTKSSSSKLINKSEIGNANYYNYKDGKYYENKEFTIEANDNTSYLLKLFSKGSVIHIPKGNYLCKKQIRLKGKKLKVYGVKGKTKIIFDGAMLGDNIKEVTENSALVNDNFSRSCNGNAAQNINISGITFEYKRVKHTSPNTILLFGNVNNVTIENCAFIADLDKKIPVTLLDLYSCCKNVTVRNCTFINVTNSSNGGSIWVRNLTREEEKRGNVTENIKIQSCTFTQNSGDETIAVFSCIGHVRGVKVSNCILYDYSPENVMVLSVYPSENKYYGTVEDVTLDNNRIYSNDMKTYTITVGGENRRNKVSDINITNNTINITNNNEQDKNSIIYICNVGTNIRNVKVNNNTISVNRLTNSTAIANANIAEANTITGKLKCGISQGEALNNIIKGSEKAIVSPEIAKGNKISDCNVGISSNVRECLIIDNEILLNRENALCGIEVLDKHYAKRNRIICLRNTIITTSEKQHSFIIHNGNVILDSNRIDGPGGMIYQGSKATTSNIEN